MPQPPSGNSTTVVPLVVKVIVYGAAPTTAANPVWRPIA